MNRTIWYIALLFITLGGVYFLIVKKPDNPFGSSDATFRISSVDRISKIFLARTNGETILLEKKANGSWSVNGSYPALAGPLHTLLQTIGSQEAAYPVPANNHNSVIRSLAANSVKVEVYVDGQDKSALTFFVGSEAHNYNGTYMLREGAEKPYAVAIPGFKGILNSRYSTSLKDWRSRAVFAADPASIKTIQIDYPAEPLNSFTIQQQSNKVSLQTKEAVGGSKPLNEQRVQSYVRFFKNLNCEGYLNGVHGLDSIIASVPKRATIKMVTNNGTPQTLDVYWMPLNRRSKNQLSSDETPDGFDADRFYGVLTAPNDTVIIQRYVFDKVFRKAYEFYEPDEAKPLLDMRDVKK